jgi:citrate synthase
MSEQAIVPGLAGIPVVESTVSYIDGKKGILEYRGYPIEDLTEHSTYLDVTNLLLTGSLGTRDELKKFTHDVTIHRRVKYKIIDLLKCMPDTGHPMDCIQAGVAALGMFYPNRDVTDSETNYWSMVRLIAKLPTIVAAFHRLRQGDHEIWPRDDLPFAANFLYMMNDRVPTEVETRIMDVCLVLHAEHTINASTFSAMVTASALADPYSVVSSAIGTLSGPLHGGANERVLKMLREIGSVDAVRPWLETKLARKEKIMGLGHRVYSTKDPRATILQKLVQPLFEERGETEIYKIAVEVERQAKELLGHRGIYPNVDFYSGIVYERLGIPTDMFTCLFAISRVAGWLAHWKEQLKDNRIYRPTQIYAGTHKRPYVSVDER